MEKGQTALEYLLIVGGIVLLATIVLALIFSGIIAPGGDDAKSSLDVFLNFLNPKPALVDEDYILLTTDDLPPAATWIGPTGNEACATNATKTNCDGLQIKECYPSGNPTDWGTSSADCAFSDPLPVCLYRAQCSAPLP